MNKNILKARRKYTKLLLFLDIYFVLVLILLSLFKINFIIYIGIALVLIINYIYYKEYIKKLNTLINIKPIKCEIVDFIYYEKGSYDSRSYKINMIVKDLKTNKLYFSYSNHFIAWWTSVYTALNNHTMSHCILRKDKSIVNIKDIVYLYIIKETKPNIEINEQKQYIKLNKEKIPFKHVNENIDINIFKNINYYEGAIEVENIEENNE